jgi:hypothetical protein
MNNKLVTLISLKMAERGEAKNREDFAIFSYRSKFG